MPAIYLRIAFSPEKQKSVKLRGSRIVFGRGRGCKVRLRSDLVSRRHCVLAYVGAGWHLRDLDSANRTFLNGKAVEAGEVREGDTLRLGEGGPTIRILRLEGVPHDEDDLQETRVVVPGRPTRAAVGPPAAEVRSSAFPWIASAGLLFGFLTGIGIWADRFPYDAVSAPALWGVKGLLELAPAFAGPRIGWLVPVTLGLYWGLVGLALQKPSRGWPLLILFAVGHTAGLMVLGGL